MGDDEEYDREDDGDIGHIERHRDEPKPLERKHPEKPERPQRDDSEKNR